jgi:uncharacterized protein Yka (UPF0111/DUF47 family)
MDDILDSIEEAARIMLEYRIEKPTPQAKKLAHIILKCSKSLEEAIGLLHNKGSKLQDILPITSDINTFENEADQVTSQAIAELFNSDLPPIYVLKWKNIYDLLEEATDFSEDAANMLEGVVLKNA